MSCKNLSIHLSEALKMGASIYDARDEHHSIRRAKNVSLAFIFCDKSNVKAIMDYALRLNGIDPYAIRVLRAYVRWVRVSEIAREEDQELAARVQTEILDRFASSTTRAPSQD